MNEHLRPIERRVLALRDKGVTIDEIAVRIRRTPAHVARIIEWTGIPRSGNAPARRLRPIERRVLALRERGESYAHIGRRFNRGADFIRQVEGLAHFKQGLGVGGLHRRRA